MMKFVVLAICVAFVFAGVPSVDFSCTKPGALVTSPQVTFNPPDLHGQENMTVTASGTLSQDVNNGTVTVTIKVAGIPLFKKKLDFCTELQQIKMACPLKAGPMSINQTFEIPTIPFQGKIEVDAELVTTDSAPKQVLCVVATVHIP